ncbi:MAG: hypothetical protein WC924_04120 [Candidatus Gracilibacteria bacterium]
MASLKQLQKDIAKIKARNRRVEADKAWETSWARKIIIAGLTYFAVVIFFFVTELPNPFANALVSSMGFILSMLSFSLLKKWWIKSRL